MSIQNQKLLPLFCLGIAACGVSDGGHLLQESTTERITPTGGATRSADGLLTVRLPAGAVSVATDLTILTDRSRTMEGMTSPVYRILPEGLSFATPIDVSMTNPAEPAARQLELVDGTHSSPLPDCAETSGVITCPISVSMELALFSVTNPNPTITSTVAHVTAGGYWGCAHHNDRTLTCWGAINNNPGPDPEPYPAGAFAKLMKGHYHHTCALRPSGEVECFGKIDFNQNPPTGTTFSDFTAGGFHNCGILQTGELQCWGHADYGQLLAPTSGTYTQLSAGITHTCALRDDGALVCWGSVSGVYPGPYTHVEAGGGTCAARPDGTLDCWGIMGSSAPTVPVAHFTVGTNHACAVLLDGTGTCWGTDLGEGETIVPTGHSFIEISAGGIFSCGLTTNGGVLCWGRNHFGQTQPPF